ncbi:MAG: NAD(P)/FAD-dependent oxidoreductase [Bacteroidales bacterium]|nr:NAD(P)/FAD-dependent oxidoreductase [Bacteroidales bacterium]
MSQERVIIVGAGIAGLTAGIYARRSGFRTLILEKCATPGGVSTCWKRGGYLFEGGVHWLNGSGKHLELHKVWEETGALGANNPVYFKDPVYVLKNGGADLAIHRDGERTFRELEAYAPADRRILRRIYRHTRWFRFFQTPVVGESPLWTYIRMFPAVVLAPFLWGQSIRHYLSGIRDKDVRTLLEGVVDPVNNALTFIFTLSAFFHGDSGYPCGGSLRMALNMADTYRRAGGELRFNTEVSQVTPQGVVVDGQLLEADAVIVAIDARTAIDRLFGEPLQDRWARRMRARLKTSQTMFIGMGIEADLSHLPKSMVCKMDPPFDVAGLQLKLVMVNNYSRDGYAPEGCTTVTALLPGPSYAFWKAAREDGTYYQQKQEVVDRVLELIYRLAPEARGHVAVTDMATPLTMERYCCTFEGSYMSDWPSRQFVPNAPNRYRKGLYFASQRTAFSGGLPPAVVSGRLVARMLCKDFGHKWLQETE